MALQMSFAKMDDDNGQPQALVARRKNDGSVSLTVLSGDDDELTRGLLGLVAAFDLVDSTTFMEMQRQMFAAQGVDMVALIDAKQGISSSE